jgi:glycosyltransferase involved in cell wall biosynthesis
LCEELARAGHRVRVLTTDAGLGDEFPSGEVNRNGVSVRYCRRAPGAGIHSPELEQQVAAEIASFDLMHVTGVWQRTSPAACRAATKAGVPYVISPRGALGPYSWTRSTVKKMVYYAFRERWNLRGAAGFHYTTLMEADECRRFTTGRNYCILPNAVVTTHSHGDNLAGFDWVRQNNLRQHCPILLSVGRIHHKKGLDLLPSALAAIKDLNWQMVFVGDDDDGSLIGLRRAFSRVGLADRIRYLSATPKENLPAIYSMASFFLLPSRHENFGNVVVEAIACGCPCILSDKVGLAVDAMESGGVLIRPRVAHLWAVALRTALMGCWQPASRPQLAAWAENKFCANDLAHKMADFYSLVVTQSLNADRQKNI